MPALVETIEAHGLDVWIYSATDWYVGSRQSPRVDREVSTSQSEPTIVSTFDGVFGNVIKIVGVSNDHDRVAACEGQLQKSSAPRFPRRGRSPTTLTSRTPRPTKAR